ncbi:MAG: Gldg family protein, partial [Deltaproteobacteria bacterium]|nr:Gldg family protein [Deltaproteobacteria bacterium]
MSPSRFRRARALMMPLGVILLVAITALVNMIASRHYARGDWTRRHVYALSAKSKAILMGLKKPVALKLLMAEPGRGSESVYRDLVELLKRLALASPKITVERVDIDLRPARAEIVAKEHHVSRAELREGVVVVAAGRRAKVIPARVLAEYDVTREGRRLVAFRGEAVLLSAILGATRRASPMICFSKGHGEAPIDSYAARGYGYLADAIRRDGYHVRDLEARELLSMKTKKLVATCKVIIVGGPTTAFAPVETDALDRYLRSMGHLFLLVGPVLDRSVTRYGSVGLETLCARWGIMLPKTIVIDPVGLPGEQPLMTWATRDGYGEHPIGRALAGRLTVWPLAREVRPGQVSVPGLRVTPLVSTSAKGWAESDLASLKGDRPLTFDAALDRRGPVSVAAAVSLLGPRIVICGT